MRRVLLLLSPVMGLVGLGLVLGSPIQRVQAEPHGALRFRVERARAHRALEILQRQAPVRAEWSPLRTRPSMILGLSLALPGATFEDRARRLLDGNPALFVDRRSGDTLTYLATETAAGVNVVRFQQHHAGVPVDGAIVAVTLDTAGRIIALSSEAEPVTLPSAQLKISAEGALHVAHRAVSRGGGGGSARLVILAEGAARLAYRVVLPFEADPAGRVHLVDASSGEYLGWRRGIISEEVRP